MHLLWCLLWLLFPQATAVAIAPIPLISIAFLWCNASSAEPILFKLSEPLLVGRGAPAAANNVAIAAKSTNIDVDAAESG